MKNTKFYTFARGLVAVVFKIFYRYKVIGRENVPESGRLLFCSNHMQFKDPILLGVIQKRQVSFMAKKELFSNKILGGLFKALGAFPVERAVGVGALRRGADILRKDGIVGMFIEGTRSKTGELLPPKSGAILLATETESPIVPVAIACRNGKPPRIFRKIYINVGKPITLEQMNLKDGGKEEMRAAGREVMAEIKTLRDEILQKKV